MQIQFNETSLPWDLVDSQRNKRLQDYSNIYGGGEKKTAIFIKLSVSRLWENYHTIKANSCTTGKKKERNRINNLLQIVWHEQNGRSETTKKKKRRAKLFVPIFVQSHNTIYYGAQFLISTCENFFNPRRNGRQFSVYFHFL